MLILTSVARQWVFQSAGRLFSSRNGAASPWMKQRELEALGEILTRLRPLRCLEWGAGFSTLYLSRFLSPNARWMSIEHDEHWAREISSLNRRDLTRIHFVPPDRKPSEHAFWDGIPDDFQKYINEPVRLGPYDFILIDGRVRTACLLKSAELIDPEGVVVLHDANRRVYHDFPGSFAHHLMLLDHRNEIGGLWIGSKARPITDVLDIEYHTKLWATTAGIGNTAIGRLIRI